MTREQQRALADSIIRREPLNEIRILLACGAKVQVPVTQGLLPLHYAVYERYYECAKLFLVRGGNVDQTDDVGYSAMHLCAERGSIEILWLLLEFKACVKFLDSTQELFPRRDMVPEEPLRLAIKNGHYSCAELLLQNGADPNGRYFMGSEINLLQPQKTEYIEMLLRYGAHVDSYDRHGMTSLMKACKCRQCIDTVRVLLSYNADPNAEAWDRQDNRRVIHFAVIGGDYQVVNLLIKQGAKVNPPADYDKAAPLDLAILRDDLHMVKLLVTYGADVNRVSGTLGTPLHMAAVAGNLKKQSEIIDFLLEHGADANKHVQVSDQAYLMTPLVEYFCGRDSYNEQIIESFLRHGAEIVFTTPIKDPRGISRALRRIRDSPHIFERLIAHAERFDMAGMKCLSARLISQEQRDVLQEISSKPLPLKHLVRLRLRKLLGGRMVASVNELPLPPAIKSFLMFQIL